METDKITKLSTQSNKYIFFESWGCWVSFLPLQSCFHQHLPTLYFHAFQAWSWSGSRSMESLLEELWSPPRVLASFTWLQLRTSALPALSLVPCSMEPSCLKFPSWSNPLCLHSLFFKVSSQNTHLIKPLSPSPPIESIKETEIKNKQPPADLLRHENEPSASAQSLFLFKLSSHTVCLFLSI